LRSLLGSRIDCDGRGFGMTGVVLVCAVAGFGLGVGAIVLGRGSG